jgi:hypothetical protein
MVGAMVKLVRYVRMALQELKQAKDVTEGSSRPFL